MIVILIGFITLFTTLLQKIRFASPWFFLWYIKSTKEILVTGVYAGYIFVLLYRYVKK